MSVFGMRFAGLLGGLVVIGMCLSPHTVLALSAKKGVGEYSQPDGARTLSQLKVSWYYDWKPAADVAGAPPGVQFIPMIWGMKNVNTHDLQSAKASGAGILLGFNEPNEKSQSNMTVQQALDAWPKLEALHMRLGSPAPGTGDDVKPNGWLAQFMAGAKARGYRVDFVCIHPYQSRFDPAQATQDLINEVTTVHNMYHLPVWVTEYAMAKWGPPQETPDAITQAKFVTESAKALEMLPFVERYAWYGDLPNQPTFSLYSSDAIPTEIGKSWAAAPGGSEASDSDGQAFFHNGLALTPPMGWSSWNNYRSDITEADIRANADAMVSNGMKAAGYKYVNIDSGWFFNKRDASGNMVPDEKRFPSGMKALADYIHRKGLKAGIYTDVGEKGCGEGGSAPQYYDRDAKQFAAWGYDLVKVDSCGANKDTDTMRSLYSKFSHAMLNAGRPMVYSICSQGEGEPWTWGPYTGNYWRDGHDVDYYNWINPSDNYLWEGVLYEINRDAPHSDVAGPGHWNDPDMLPIGGVRAGNKPQPGGQFLTPDEENTTMSVWAMLSAPLIVGAKLPDVPPSSLQVLLNREVIAVDQDPDAQQAHLVEEQGPGLEVWEKPLHGSSPRRSAVALVNTTPYVEKITYRASVAGHGNTFNARGLWQHSELGAGLREYTATIPPHGTVLLMLLWNAH